MGKDLTSSSEIDLSIRSTADELIDQLMFGMSESELVAFVILLDEKWQSYGFSEPLYKHFKKQHKLKKKEDELHG